MCHGRLFTNERKYTMKIGDPFCRHNGNEIESVVYVTRDFPLATAACMELVHQYDKQWFFNGNLAQWMEQNMQHLRILNYLGLLFGLLDAGYFLEE